MLSGAGTRHFISLLFILLIGLGIVMRLDINPFHGYVIGFLMWRLVDEDFRTMLVDLRWVAFLAVMSVFAVKNIPSAILSAVIAMLIFDTIRFATCKFISMDETRDDADASDIPSETKNESDNNQGRRYGYIPFLVIAFMVYIWYVGLVHPDIPWFLEPVYIMLTDIEVMATENPVTAIMMFLALLALNAKLRMRASDAKKNGMMIVPGFGAGDPPVLAVLAVLLGIQETMLVFFISLLFSLPAAVIQERSML